MKKFCLFIFLALSFGLKLFGQSAAKGFSSLSRPEKCWVFFHPFIAKKVFHCATRTRYVTDSLKNNRVLSDGNGGQLDAFRHAYWMALLVQEISAKKACRVGEVHEKGNYRQFLHGQLEDSIRPDSMMSVMDLKNNTSGIQIGMDFKNDTSITKKNLEATVINSVTSGKLVILKKDPQGHFVDVKGRMIDIHAYHQQWSIPKCIVRSDYRMQPVDGN